MSDEAYYGNFSNNIKNKFSFLVLFSQTASSEKQNPLYEQTER